MIRVKGERKGDKDGDNGDDGKKVETLPNQRNFALRVNANDKWTSEDQTSESTRQSRINLGSRNGSETKIMKGVGNEGYTRYPGYTIEITFHEARNLPRADIGSGLADGYVVARLQTELTERMSNDGSLTKRTPTVRRSINPKWETEWTIGNVPSSGFKLCCDLFDEDERDKDDRLGQLVVNFDNITESWSGVSREWFNVKTSKASKRILTYRWISSSLKFQRVPVIQIQLSIRCLGYTWIQDSLEDEETRSRSFTLGPCWWSRHYSPLLGMIVRHRDNDDDKGIDGFDGQGRDRVGHFNFQANQFQLCGPVPGKLNHRYVEYRPFIHLIYSTKNLAGLLLNRALHHQHGVIYRYDQSTVQAVIADAPSVDMTKQFLKAVHRGKNGRIFTYVILLDGLMRFTETGRDFGIDFLSKHSMHSDVAVNIAYSGEFFVRTSTATRPASSHERDSSKASSGVVTTAADAVDIDVSAYELFIDNDSGTYRPKGEYLRVLKGYLNYNFPGLTITTIDCVKQSKQEALLKNEQRRNQIRFTKPWTSYHDEKLHGGKSSSESEDAVDVLRSSLAYAVKTSTQNSSSPIKSYIHKICQRFKLW